MMIKPEQLYLDDVVETPVEIRGADSIGSVVLTITEPLITMPPETEAVLHNDTSMCCEDCPEVVEYPPEQSNCEYFYNPGPGARPECTHPDRPSNKFRNFFFGS